MHDVAEFLTRYEPFSGLDEAELERLGQRTEVEFFAADTTIIGQGDRPQSKVRVVRRGAVELVDGGRVLDVLGEGELFGHPSMLSGLPAEVEARAREDSLCYAIAGPEVAPLLARPAGLRFVARSLLARRPPGAGGGDVAGAELSQQPVTALIRRQPVIAEPDVSLREIAQRMVAGGVSAALVRRGDGELGIVTARDLTSRVVAEGLPADTPVGEVITAPIVAVGTEQTGADVMLAMLDNDVHHVPVLSPRSEVIGVISALDLFADETRTPFVLRREIAEATDKADLGRAADRLRSTVVALHRADLPPAQISEVISVVADALIRRMIELAIASEGAPPTEFAWMALGSHGRREAVPSSDVDSGMAWRDEADAPERYMRAIADDVADCIAVIGWRLDPHGVTASGSFSASSIGDWRRAIETWLANPSDERVLIATSILLDGRTVYGPERELDVKSSFYEAASAPTLLRWMLRLALASKPPTGFMRDIVVEGSGERRGTFDIKHGGLLPIVDLARYAGLRAELRLTSTVERLRAAGEAGTLEPAQARTLEEAYDLFAALRLEHQVRQLESGLEPDDHLDPGDLNSLTRHYLRDAFREVAAVQRSLAGELHWTA